MSALFLSVSYLGNEPVELVLLVGGVEGDRLHAHGLAVLPGLVLLKVTAAKLPGHHEALALPEVVGSLGGALGGASSDAEMIRGHHQRSSGHNDSRVGGSGGEARLGRLSHWLGWLRSEGWSLLEASLRGGPRLELLLLRLWLELLLLGLELLLLRLEELLLLLRLELLLLLLLKLGPWPLWLGSIICDGELRL